MHLECIAPAAGSAAHDRIIAFASCANNRGQSLQGFCTKSGAALRRLRFNTLQAKPSGQMSAWETVIIRIKTRSQAGSMLRA